MPVEIRYIDAIARAKGRDALYLEFHPEGDEGWSSSRDYDWQADPVRQKILDWLEQNGFNWEMCGPFADVRSLPPYRGQIYLDVPWDEKLEAYCRLRDYLEYPDGSIRHPGVRFYACAIDMAMKNAQHDEPGFWERWADNF